MPSNEENFWIQLLEAVPAGVVHVAKGGSILRANREACRVLGLSYDALTKRYTHDFVTESVLEDGTPCSNDDFPVVQALAGHKPASRTIGVRRSDGTTAWALFSASPIYEPNSNEVSSAVVAFLDVTERKERDAELRVSEATLRAILESAPDYILTADLEGKIQFLNRSMAPYSPSDFIGASIYDQVVPEMVETVRDCVAGVIQTGEVAGYEVRTKISLGERIFDVQVGAVRTGGEIVGITMVTRDLTEHRQLQLRLSIADRMASIGQLAAGVAHEINNPLTYVMASLEQIKRATAASPKSPALASALAAADEGLSRIRTVVRDLSSFSRSSAGERGVLEVQPVLESAVRMAHAELAARTRVVREYAPSPPVFANEARLGQVFLNLVINAAQAMSETAASANELRIATRTDDAGRCVVEVSDTGSGIPPALVGRIFEPFVTTKPPGVGTGLGLSICRDIMTSLGGTISVRSDVGIGTTFTVILPPAEAAREHMAARVEPTPSRPREERRHVLVIDDEPAILTAILSMLPDHDVVCAASGKAALELLGKRDFDVILCDVMMHGMSGMDVYDHLVREARGRDERMIFMTGNAYTDAAREFMRARPDRVLEKPFVADDLVRAIARAR